MNVEVGDRTKNPILFGIFYAIRHHITYKDIDYNKFYEENCKIESRYNNLNNKNRILISHTDIDTNIYSGMGISKVS